MNVVYQKSPNLNDSFYMKYVFVVLFSLFVGGAFGQQTGDSLFYRKPENKSAQYLKPIEMASAFGPYMYGGKRLRSPFSLEVPFYELDDPGVNKFFISYRICNTVSQMASFVPLVYIFTRSRTNRATPNEYLTVFLGSLTASLGASIFGQFKLRQAVNRYNAVLAHNQLGLSVQSVPFNNTPVVGGSFIRRF